MDILNHLNTAWGYLRTGWRSASNYASVVSDTNLIKEIGEAPSLEAYSLSVLGINEQDLKNIKAEKADKREYIRLMIETSDPSFGRFMTENYQYYQRLRSGGKGDPKKLLKLEDVDAILKQLQDTLNTAKSKQDLKGAALELGVLAYRLTRAKA